MLKVFLVKLLGESKVEFCLLPHPRLVLLLCWRIIPVTDVWKQQFTGNNKYIPLPPRLPGITGKDWSQAARQRIFHNTAMNRIIPTSTWFGMQRDETHLKHQQFRQKGYTEACKEVTLIYSNSLA